MVKANLFLFLLTIIVASFIVWWQKEEEKKKKWGGENECQEYHLDWTGLALYHSRICEQYGYLDELGYDL